MVQVLDANDRDALRSDKRAAAFSKFSGGLGNAAEAFIKEFQGKKEREELAKRFGDEFKNIRNPPLQQLLTQRYLQKETAQDRFNQEMSQGLMDYDTVKKYAGKEVADFYKASTIGGKTKIIQSIVDSLERGENFGDLLEGASGSDMHDELLADQNEFQEPEKNKIPDFTVRPKGFTRADWAKERNGWAKKNTDSLEAARDRLKGNKRDILGTQKLQKLNDSHELPEGLERLIINPKTGEPYKLAQLTGQSPTAAQEWVKEIARFGNRAKDAFGSRVTNFDLSQYMKQFPSLLNTPEGRNNILHMMQINYQLDSLYDKAVQQIIDKKGEGNIPPAQVDKIAREMIKDEEEQLFQEYLNAEEKNEDIFLNQPMKRLSLEEIFGE